MSIVRYENRYRVLAIDPSSNHTGFSVLDYDLLSRTTYVVHSHTVHRNAILKANPWLASCYGDRAAGVHGYALAMRQMLTVFDPTAVIVESPYMSRLITAFRALTEMQAVLREEVIRWDITAPFWIIDPSTVKKNIGVPGTSNDKDLIGPALARRSDLVFLPEAPLHVMDEHERDSVAVGLYHIDHHASKIL